MTVATACPLATTPTAELVAELVRRGYLVLDPGTPLEVGGLTLFAGRHLAVWRGKAVRLTRREGDVLAVLMGRYPGTIKGPQLTCAIWGDWCDPNLGRVYVVYLRRKLGKGAIATDRGGGYRLALEASA